MSRFRVLLSYHYFKQAEDMGRLLDEHFGADTHPEVFADSGAFSALTQGAPIDLHQYARWLQANERHFAVYANLDVIGDGEAAAEGTWQNQRVLEDEYGLRPLPVFHAGEPWSALERYLEAGYRYIALGGLVGRPRNSIMPWLVSCFRRAEGVAVFHGFGLTSWEPLKALPWYSVDSSSWGSGYRYGIVRLWDDRRGRMEVFTLEHENRYKHGQLLRTYGFTPADIEPGTDGLRQRLAALSAASWRRAEAWLRRRHGRIQIPGAPDDVPPGLRWYNADNAPSNLANGAEGLRLYCADGSLQNLGDGAQGLRLYLADTNLNDLAAGAAGTTTQGEAP